MISLRFLSGNCGKEQEATSSFLLTLLRSLLHLLFPLSPSFSLCNGVRVIPLHDDKPMHPWLPVKHVGSGENGRRGGRNWPIARNRERRVMGGGEHREVIGNIAGNNGVLVTSYPVNNVYDLTIRWKQRE